MNKRIALLLAPVILGLILFACQSRNMAAPAETIDPNAIRIGLLAPLSGPLAGFGRGVEIAARFAAQEINAAGGIDGKPIAFIVADGGCSAAVAPTAARYLLSQGVVAIIGEGCSGATIAAAQQVCIPAGVPMISPSSTSPSITTLFGSSGLIFRTAPSDAFQGVILAKKVWDSGVKTTSVLFVDNAYGRGLADAFKVAYLAKGGAVPAFVPYADGQEIGFTNEVAALFAPGVPAGVLLVTYETDGANVTRDLKLFNPLPAPKYFGVDGNKGSSFLANAEPSIIEGMQGTVPVPPVTDPNYLAFKANYIAATRDHEDPGTYGENAYDAVYLVAYAMVAGGPTSAGIKANVKAMSRTDTATPTFINTNEWAKGVAAIKAGKDLDYNGASGKIDLDANGDPTSGTYSWWRIQGGQYIEVETISFP